MVSKSDRPETTDVAAGQTWASTFSGARYRIIAVARSASVVGQQVVTWGPADGNGPDWAADTGAFLEGFRRVE
jgi:hypothetical protein